MIILGALSGGNMAVRKDGSGGFARTLEKRYLALAGDCWVIRIFNYCPNCAPANRTLVQVMIESEWQPWKEIRENKDAYNRERNDR